MFARSKRRQNTGFPLVSRGDRSKKSRVEPKTVPPCFLRGAGMCGGRGGAAGARARRERARRGNGYELPPDEDETLKEDDVAFSSLRSVMLSMAITSATISM